MTTDRSVHYQNSEAAIAHLQKVAVTFGERYATMVERNVFGNPSGELRTLLDRYGSRTTSHLARSLIGG